MNDTPIHVSATSTLLTSVLSTGFAYDRLTRVQDNHAEFCRLNLLSQGVRRLGAAGLDLAFVACGRLDGFWEYGLQPWDIAGGSLLISEAGGVVSTLSGQPHRLESPDVAVSNGLIHKDLLAALASARALAVNSREGLDAFLPRGA